MRAWLAIAIVAIVSSHTLGQQPGANPRAGRLPAGFSALDDTFREGPWVFATSGTNRTALPRVHNAMEALINGPLPIQLDDGSTGTLRVESKPCTSADDCAPFDCGCILPYESYWIDVADSTGDRVAHLHLWAAYGVYDFVAVDLIDGPGDELMIIRMPAHSAPPPDLDLKIWKLGSTKPVDLGEEFRVTGYLGTRGDQAISCALWKTRLVVNPGEAKPRSVALQGEFAAAVDLSDATSVCRLDKQGADRVATLERGQVLRFQRGKYRLR